MHRFAEAVNKWRAAAAAAAAPGGAAQTKPGIKPAKLQNTNYDSHHHDDQGDSYDSHHNDNKYNSYYGHENDEYKYAGTAHA